MSLSAIGLTINSKAEIDSATKAARVSLRAIDWSPNNPYLVGGSYSRRHPSTMVCSASMVGLAQFRWTSADALCAIRRITYALGSSNISTAEVYTYQLFFARFFSGAGAAGTAWAGPEHSGKKRALKNPTQVSDFRVATSLGTSLTAGTWQLDADPLVTGTFSVVAVANQAIPQIGNDGIQVARMFTLWEAAQGEHPIVLAANEGVTIIMAPQGGSSNAGGQLRFEWEELPVGGL